MSALLAMKERRDPVDLFYRNSFLVGLATVFIVSLIVFVACWLWQPAGMLETTMEAGYGTLQAITWILGVVVMVGGASRQLQKDSSIFASFIHGQCMPEVLGTLTSSAEMVDGVARHSAVAGVKATARGMIPLALLMVICFPSHLKTVGMVLALWAPLTLGTCWGGAYLSSQLAIWNSQLRNSLTDSLVGLVTGLPAAGFLVTTGVLVGCQAWPWAAVTFGSYLVVTAVGARWVAILGLERLPHLQRQARQAGRKLLGVRRNPLIRTRSENPIVVRETARDAATTPGGPLGWLFWRHGLVLVFLCFMAPYLWKPRGAEEAFWGLLFMIPSLFWFLAARRTAGAVVTEVENKTLDVVKQTCLRAEQYVDGWLRVASEPRLRQQLFLLFPLALLGYAGKVESVYLVPLLLLYFLAPVQGAALGLYASVAPSRAESQKRLSGLLFSVPAVFWFGICLFGSLLLPQGMEEPMFLLVLLLLYSVGYAAFFRYRTIRALEGR